MAKVEDMKAVIHNINFKYDWKLVIVLTLLVVTCGCQKSLKNRVYQSSLKKRVSQYNLKKLGGDLDKMAQGREKFGTISFSQPILVESKKDQPGPFDFTLTTGPDDYYNHAQNIVQGKMAGLSQFIKDTGVNLSIQGDIPTGIKAGQDTITLPGPNTPTPVQPSNNITPPGEDSSKNTTGFLGLLEGTPDLKISNRSAINTAAGDTVTEAIFTILGNPSRTAQFKDKLMLFGVSMVSITPGYVTREGYTGELSVLCDYYYDIARRDLLEKIKKVEKSKGGTELLELIEKVINKQGIKFDKCKASKKDEQQLIDKHIPQRYQRKFREDFTPLAAAVSPMTDVEALDLSSSIRNQTFSAMKIAAALSYAGLEGKAEIFENWARKLQQDTRTLTPYAAITSFSNGEYFGFRVRPRLKAIKDGKKPGYVLEDQSFPVVVIVGIDTDDLKLAFDFERNDHGHIKKDHGMARLVAYEPTIKFHQTVNWLPNKQVSFWDKLRGNQLTETSRLEWLDIYIKELQKTKAIKKTNFTDPMYFFKNYAYNRIELLGSQILGTHSIQYLPMEFLAGKPVKGIPKVNKPNHDFVSWYDAPGTFVIKGENFEGQVLGANIGGHPCKVEVVGDKITLVTSSAWTPKLDQAAALAEKKIAQAELDIANANKRINDAQKRINEANEILKSNSQDKKAINEKKKAEADLTTATNDLAISKANKKKAEADKRLAMSQTGESKKLQINLITTKGGIKAGFVRFAHQTTPAKTGKPSNGMPKTDATAVSKK